MSNRSFYVSNRFTAGDIHSQSETLLLMVNHYAVDILLQRSAHDAQSLRQT